MNCHGSLIAGEDFLGLVVEGFLQVTDERHAKRLARGSSGKSRQATSRDATFRRLKARAAPGVKTCP